MVDRLGWTLVHSVWEGAAVALLLAVLMAATRRASANLRYGLACAALALLAALPAATFVALAAPATDPWIATATGTSVVTAPVVLGKSAQSVLPILVALWAAGAAALSLRLLGTLLQIERWRRRHSRPAGPEWQARVDALARRLDVRRNVAVLVSDRIGVPSAWGVLKAVVVLPASLVTSLPPEGVETILLHELAHIRRHDYLVNLLQTVVETALFYHPAVWWVSSLVRREREHCCDDVVVATLADPMPYARALLFLEERRSTLPRPTLSAKGTPLMNRIARILGTPPAPSRLSPAASTLAALAVLGVVLGGAYQAQAQDAPKKAAQASTRNWSYATLVPTQKKPTTKSTANDRKQAIDRYNAARKAEMTAHEAALRAEIARLQAQIDATRAVTLTGAKVGVSPAKVRIATAARATSAPTTARPEPDKVAVAMPAPISGGSVPYVTPHATAQEIDDGIVARGDQFDIDLKDAPFAAAMRRLAQKSSLQFVIAPGVYEDLTIRLNGRAPQEAAEIFCRAANATFRIEGGVYYFSSKYSPARAGGGFGGGGFVEGGAGN